MRALSFVYTLLRWLVLLLLLLIVFLFFALNSPAPILKLLKEPLASQGIEYGKLEGGLLTGFKLSDVNYDNKVKAKSAALKVDFDLLEKRILSIDHLYLEDAQIDKNFLKELVDANGTKKEKNESNTSLPFDKVVVKELKLSLQDTSYEKYHINHAEIIVNNFETDMKKRHKGEVELHLDSNVSQVDLKANFKEEKYELEALVVGERTFLKPILEESELILLSNPKFDIKAKGDMNRVNYVLKTKALDIKYQAYESHTKLLNVSGYYDLNSSDIKTKIKADLDANVAKLTMDSDVFVNLNDINNSLLFTLNSDLKSKTLSKGIVFAEQNLSIEKLPSFTIFAKGGMQKVDFKTKFNDLKVKQNKLSFLLKALDLSGSTEPIDGDTIVKLGSTFDSSMAKGKIEADAKLNFLQLEESLEFNANADLSAYEAYLNPLLKESNLTIKGDTLVKASASGNFEALKVKADISTRVIKEKISSKIALTTEDILVNLKDEKINGALSLKSDAPNLALNMQSRFAGNYMKPKLLKTDTKLELTSFNAFGVNLTAFMPLSAKVNSTQEGGALNIVSKKLNLKAKSRDYDHVTFEINSEKIYPSTIMDLPKELKGKFVKLNLSGDATLSKQYFTLQGLLEANKNFKLNLQAKSKEEGLNVNIFSKHLKINAKGNVEDKKIQAVVKIDSVEKLQNELQALYAFSAVEVDGALTLNATLDGEKVNAKVTSEKLAFKDFAIEELDVDANYEKDLVTISKLDFKTTGFEKKKLNKHYYLNRQATINLGEKRDVEFDMHPNILVKATGNSKRLDASVKVESLALGHPEYGDFELNCDIDYHQDGEKKRILGAIFLDKMKLNYESKFLDPSQDNDVIVLSKKDKKKKEKDSFLEDTFIDLYIYANEANYKTKDIDLKLGIDLKAKKEFGEPLGMFGKVKEINGRVEQAPKLFTVVDSNIVFKGEKEINPLLDIAVEYELPDVLITINIYGNAKRPKLTFSSEPPLPKKDILSYLLLGVSTANLANGEGSLGREAQLFIMNQAARDLAYEVELDRIFIKDDGTGEGYAVQVGKKVKDNSMLIIENSKEGNSLILEHEVNKNIKVEIGHHQKTVPSQSIDVYFRKRFK